MVVIHGRKYRNLQQASKVYGLEFSYVRKMLGSGHHVNEVFIITDENKGRVEKVEKFEGGTITVHGREFYSYLDVSRCYGVGEKTISERVKNGFTVEEVVDEYLKKKKDMEVTVNGKTFPNKSSACSYHNVDPSTIHRLCKEKKMSFEEAINFYISEHSISVHGKTFKSYSDISEYYSINKNQISEMLSGGFNIEEIVDYYLQYREDKEVTIKGIKFSSKKKACEYFGISYLTISKCMSRNDLSFENAINIWVMQEPVVFEKRFSSLSEACEYYSKKPSEVYYWLSEGYSLDDAFSMKEGIARSKNEKVVLGKRFSSEKEACAYFNVGYATYWKRVKKYGYSDEEALEIVGKFSDASKPLSANPYFNSKFKKSWKLLRPDILSESSRLVLMDIRHYCNTMGNYHKFVYRLHMVRDDLVVSYYDSMSSSGVTFKVSDDNRLLQDCKVLLYELEKVGISVKEIYWFNDSNFKAIKSVDVGGELLLIIK